MTMNQEDRDKKGASSPPQVLCIATDFPPEIGGIQILTLRLVEHLDAYEIDVVAPPSRQDGEALQQVRILRPPFLLGRLPHKAEILLVNAMALAVAWRRRPDVVLNMHVASSPAARLIRRLWRIPFVQYTHAREVPARPKFSAAAFESASKIVAVSSYCRGLILEQADVADRIAIVSPGADLPAEAQTAPVESSNKETSSILIIGRLESSYKGHDTLIRAIPHVRKVVPNVRCRIVGEGALRKSLEDLAAAVGARDSVDFLGAVSNEQKNRELIQASVFCMPSRLPDVGAGEGFGIVYLEAGAFGLPVVAVRAGGAIDAVVDNETGILIRNPLDHIELGSALARVLTDPDLSRRLGSAGRQHTLAHTWKLMADKVSQLCDEVITSPS